MKRIKRKSKKNNKVIISDEIRATVVNHVVNHGLTIQEAGQRVQPNISRFSVASILRHSEEGIGKKHYYDRKTLV